MGQHSRAESLYAKSRAILRKTVGEKHPDYATALDNLAELCREMGRYQEAEKLYHEALRVYRAMIDVRPAEVANVLNNLGALYKVMGCYSKAEPLYEEAIRIRREVLGEGHPDYSISLENLAALYVATDRAEQAFPLMQQSAAIDNRNVAELFAVASESQRLEILRRIEGKFFGYLSLVLRHFPRVESAVRSAFMLTVWRKAIFTEAVVGQREQVLGDRFPDLKSKLDDLTALRRQIAQKTISGPGADGLELHQGTLNRWNAQRNELEAELAREIPEIALDRRLRAADRRAVALALPEGSALIEFIRVEVFDFQAVPARGESTWKPAHYVAFVLLAGEPDSLRMVDLGEAKPIDQMIADFREGIIGETEERPDRDMIRRDARIVRGATEHVEVALRQAVFDKLRWAIDGRKRLLVAPDGDINRLPFEVLPTDDGRRLIDDYSISYLSCGRDVLRFEQARTRQPSQPLVVADPDFDLEVGVTAGHAPAETYCGRLSRDLKPGELYFPRLPGTRSEAECIGSLLRVRPWLAADVLEKRLKQMRSPRVLHIATHGFFLADQDRDPNEGRCWVAASDLGRLAGLRLENPLLRSGLALAGANSWLKKRRLPSEAEDGLLTAEDVTGLDLQDTELVVLSACNTGMGEIRAGNGVFGLRRAFVLAGANTLVMSLWKVPDEPTRELMEDFYRRLLDGQSRSEALRQAQLVIKAKYPLPCFWGAFICQGAPGPLDIARAHGDSNTMQLKLDDSA